MRIPKCATVITDPGAIKRRVIGDHKIYMEWYSIVWKFANYIRIAIVI